MRIFGTGPYDVENVSAPRIIQCMTVRRTAQACVSLAAMLLTSTAALCDDSYDVTVREGGIQWIAILYALVCLAGICVVAFKHARRTHLD